MVKDNNDNERKRTSDAECNFSPKHSTVTATKELTLP